MRTSRLTHFWNERPWRRRKIETEPPKVDSVIAFQPAPISEDAALPVDLSTAANTKGSSRFFRNGRSSSSVGPSRSNSIRQLVNRRSAFNPDDEPILIDGDDDQDITAPQLKRESFLKRIHRRSQSFALPRPSSSGSIFRRHTLSGEEARATARDSIPDVPALPPVFSENRPRHVPISIDYLHADPGSALPFFGAGMAITSNEVQSSSPLSAHRSTSRPMSSSSNFSQIRTRPSARPLYQHTPMLSMSSELSDDDVITALPSMDFKDFHLGELNTPLTHMPSTIPVRLRKESPKLVEILAPRPLSIISSQPQKSALPAKERHKSMAPTPSSPIGTLEDGPKGDWSRTRHSWMGAGNDFEQMEWDKLKQFMEAYGSGQHAGVISVRAVGTDSTSSGSVRDSGGAHFSNAQALAALEFGL